MSDNKKRKRKWCEYLAEEIDAFANNEEGEIWLGVEDGGTLTGLWRSYEENVMGICRTAYTFILGLRSLAL